MVITCYTVHSCLQINSAEYGYVPAVIPLHECIFEYFPSSFSLLLLLLNHQSPLHILLLTVLSCALLMGIEMMTLGLSVAVYKSEACEAWGMCFRKSCWWNLWFLVELLSGRQIEVCCQPAVSEPHLVPHSDWWEHSGHFSSLPHQLWLVLLCIWEILVSAFLRPDLYFRIEPRSLIRENKRKGERSQKSLEQSIKA